MLNLRSSRLGIMAAAMLSALPGAGSPEGGNENKRRPLCDRRKRKGNDPRKIKRKMQKSSRKANR